jgi:hypothetical protein
MPPTLTDIYDKLSPTLEQYKYRNLFALESMVGKAGLWLADPCCRFGSPVAELELELITNLPEIMWEGAAGNLIEPIYKARYGCEALIKSQWACNKPMLIEYPDEYSSQIKLSYVAKFGNEKWLLPQHPNNSTGAEEVGAIIAYGATLDDCISEICEIGEQIKGTQLEITTGSMDTLKNDIKDLASWGIDF